jgi:hypothetical protein
MANGHSLKQLTQEEMRLALERVLNSKHFVHAPMKQKFLRLICEFYLNGRGAELNEYLIGREVFDRGDSYNPATDPIVRVGAHGVREKLALYYRKEGTNDEVRIEIPVGSYAPTFTRAVNADGVEPLEAQAAETEVARAAELQQSLTPPGEAQKRLGERLRRLWPWPVLVLLLAAVIVLLVINRRLNQQIEVNTAARAANQYGAVWEPFLKSSDPTVLILSNPVVHRPANGADPERLTRNGIKLSAEQASVLTNATGNRLPLKPNQPMQLVPAFDMFTGIGEAVGVYRLSNLLQAAGETTLLKQSRSIGPEDLKNYDLIFLGSVYTNQWSKPLSVKENFVYTSRTTIENLEPRQGEEREYKPVFNEQTGNLIEDYALITVTPGVAEGKTIMVLAGIYSEGTEAAAEYVTGQHHLNELNQRLRQVGQPGNALKYYQALLKVRVENSFPTKISLLTVRELQATGQ